MFGQKFGIINIFKYFLKEVSHPRQAKTVILWNIVTVYNNCFLWIYRKMQFMMQSWIFSIITPVFSVTWSFRNHSNMLICCSGNVSYCFQCWKQLCCFIWCWKFSLHHRNELIFFLIAIIFHNITLFTVYLIK